MTPPILRTEFSSCYSISPLITVPTNITARVSDLSRSDLVPWHFLPFRNVCFSDAIGVRTDIARPQRHSLSTVLAAFDDEDPDANHKLVEGDLVGRACIVPYRNTPGFILMILEGAEPVKTASLMSLRYRSAIALCGLAATTTT